MLTCKYKKYSDNLGITGSPLAADDVSKSQNESHQMEYNANTKYGDVDLTPI